MKENYVAVVGMVRSGTTLISRAIDAHSKIAVAPDPYLGFFKEFRNEICKDFSPEFDEECPLSDNFFNTRLDVKRRLVNATFVREIKNQDLGKIKRRIINLAENNAPGVVPHVKEMNASNYEELFIKLMDIIKKSYGDTNTKIVGFKQTWVEEFTSPMINTFPNMKCIHIIRDPRAIIASRKRTTWLAHNYPILFMLRHWRKSCAYALHNGFYNKNNVYVVKYEDLTSAPEAVLKEICNFLDVEYERAMIDTSNYRDGVGSQWTDNSAYGRAKTITAKFQKKWKDVLSEKELQFIEDLCDIEMKAFNYDRETSQDLHHSLFLKIKLDELDDDWIEKYGSQPNMRVEDIKNELLRYYLYKDGENKIDNDLLEAAFIVPDFLKLVENGKRMTMQ